MSDPLSPIRISRRAVLGGMLSLAAAALGLSACCPSDTVRVELLYSTEKDAWLQDTIQKYMQTCPQVNQKQIQIVAHDSGSVDIADQILKGTYPLLVACSPASELELSRLDYLWMSKHGQSIVNYTSELGPQRLVQSPLVFAIWQEFANALLNHYGRIDWDTLSQALQRSDGWQGLGLPNRGTQIHLGQTVPTGSNSGLMAITLMASAYLTQNQISESLLTVEGGVKEVMKDTGLWDYIDVFERHVNVYGKSSGTYFWNEVIGLGPAQYAIVLTYENLVLFYNKHGNPELNKQRSPEQPLLEMFYPEQNVRNDHPFAILENPILKQAGQLQEQQSAAKAFRDFLLQDEQQKAALQYGFRLSKSTQPLVDPEKNDPVNPFDQLKPTNQVSLVAPTHTLDTDITYIDAPGGDVADELIKQWNSRYPNPNVI